MPPLHSAFFYVDSSQLLPSSSSSRPLNANLSQGMGGASKRGDQKRSGSSQQDVIVQSDKAERLYKAAISSPTSSANQLSPPDKEAPVSLVRQMQVSIREAAKHGGGGSGEQGDTKTSERRKGPSASPQEAHGSMGFDAASEEQQRTLGKLPSLHSLRTLRLSAQSLGSPSLSELEKDSSLEGRFGGEDEEWSQRGRTRSKRGLAWIDSGPSKDARQLQGKARLEGLFNEEGQASGIEADQAGGGADEIDEVSAGNCSCPSLPRTASNADAFPSQVPNALRLTAKESATMREVQERLKATSTIAEVWDAGQDN